MAKKLDNYISPLSIRMTKHEPLLDEIRRYLSDAPTLQKMAQYLRDSDSGDIALMTEIAEEIEAKDAHIQGVAQKRRQAITALEWDIEPDPDARDDNAAAIGAKYCRETLKKVRRFASDGEDGPSALNHLATAIGPGIAALELVWTRGELTDVIPVPANRLVRPWETNKINVLTLDEPIWGIEAKPPKFGVFMPYSRPGIPLKVTLLRATLFLWTIKHLCVADWSAFSEVFGMPWRTATVPKSMIANKKEMDELKKALRDARSDFYAIIQEGVNLDVVRADQANPPYETFIDWIERKLSILWLGQTLTTEMQSTGSFAAAKVHENVAASLLLSDLKVEAAFIEQHILRPMIDIRFPRMGIPVPKWKRRVIEGRNLEADRMKQESLRLAMAMGLPLRVAEVYEALGFTKPEDGEEGLITPNLPAADSPSQTTHGGQPPATETSP